MQRRHGLAIVGLAVLLTALMAQSPPPSGPPKLVLSQPNWDFGKVWESEPQTMQLQIRNEGQGPLAISEVRSTCGCTVAQPEKRNLQPGEATAMNVRFDTHGKQGDVSSKVIILSNDPAAPEVQFPIKGFVRRAVTREPMGGLAIRTLDPKPGSTGVVRLQNQLDEPMKVELVRSSMPEIEVEIREVTPGIAYEIVGKLAKELAPGTLRGDITVKTGLSRESTLQIPVRVQVLSRVELVPPALFIRAQDTKPVERIVNLQYYGPNGSEFKIVEAKPSDPRVTVTVQPTRPPEPWMANMKPPITANVDTKVMIPPGRDFPPQGFSVDFITNDPEQPKVTVLITTDKTVFDTAMYGRYSGGAPPAAGQ